MVIIFGFFGLGEGARELDANCLARVGPTRSTVTFGWPAGRDQSGGIRPAELEPGYWKLML